MQRQELVDLGDGGRLRGDQAREAARREHPGRPALLLLDAFDHAVHHRDVTEEYARLDRVHGVAPDHPWRLEEFDGLQLRGPRVERLEGDAHARRNHAPQILATGAHHVEGRRRAEVHDDRQIVVTLVGCHRVDDAVGSDLARVVVEDRHARAGARTDDQRHPAEGVTAHLVDDRLHRGNHIRDDCTPDERRRQVGHPEQVPDDDAVLVGGAALFREHPPVAQQTRSLEETEHGMRVSNVDREQHRRAGA